MDRNNSGFMSSVPVVTRNIIIINALLWLADALLSKDGSMGNLLGLHFFASNQFKPYQFITYMFMHGGFTHLLFNMFAVFMFGRTLELIWGPKKFLIFYFLTGLGAAITQQLVFLFEYHTIVFDSSMQLINIGSAIVSRTDFFNMLPVTIGASGAVFGILVAFGMLFPNIKLYIIPIPIPIKAKWLVTMYALFELGMGIYNSSSDDVAHFAHLGGLVTGIIIILIWRRNMIKSNRNF